MVKNLPIQETEETQVPSLGQEDPLEEGMATNSSILARRIPWTEEPGGLQSMGSQRVGHDWATEPKFTAPAGEGESNPVEMTQSIFCNTSDPGRKI